MRIIDNILYLEVPELEACGVPRRTILSWDAIKDPSDKRKTLIQYEDLKSKYQDMIIKRFGDPYTYYHNQIIKQYLRTDTKAMDYFTAYRKDAIALPNDTIKEYVTCANWLNLLIELDNNWSKCKKVLCMDKKPELYDAIARIFEADVIKLPKVYVPLKRKIAEYKDLGYECIVSGKWGNTNSKKVKDELNNALLIEMISHPAQYSDLFIAEKYNLVAVQAGFKTITAVTVGNYRHNNAVEIDGYRYGKDVWYNKAGKVINRKRSTAPLLLINSDDNELDVFFQQVKTNKKGHDVAYHYYRPTLYIVIDAFNDYILGYAIGDTNTKDLIKAAYLNAANHVKELTGGRYFWHQIQTDRWGIDREAKNDFSQWFSNQAEFSPTQLGNSRGKVIEQTFRGNWSSKLRELFPNNYSGPNVTAKTKISRDWLESNKKSFPTVDQAADLVANFINELRNMPDKTTGTTKQQQWLNAFGAMQENKKRIISDEQHLMLLGYDHVNQHTGQLELNTLTNKGLTPILQERKRIYEAPKELYLKTLGTTCKIKYDPYDLRGVLAISADEKTRLMCYDYELVAMAKADYEDHTSDYLNSRIGEKAGHVKMIATSKETRQSVLQRARMDAASYLSAGGLVKELKHAATQLLESDFDDYTEDIDINSMM
ncbi:hypothetical protein [Mucilaginibacter sp. 5C4]|uniref:hypothetical protein n=1 Tax=Mucilaginibacter sp. 5C4 TaxID=3048589 RepID=UPI002AC9552E|nr:hypothetical protein [Mucilaginibacter sp. 5C4]MEB0299585.1 hypothetical protein [Mucilaginibacter sp. 5C4]WPX22950.1 hypothetical protein RHM67_16845 [Mucilaginibacter sp. 5C4]